MISKQLNIYLKTFRWKIFFIFATRAVIKARKAPMSIFSMTVTSGLVYRMRLTTHRAPNKGNQKGQEKDVDLSEDDTIESFSTVTISETTNNMSHKNEE